MEIAAIHAESKRHGDEIVQIHTICYTETDFTCCWDQQTTKNLATVLMGETSDSSK